MVAAPIYVQPQGIAAKEQTSETAEEFFREAVQLYASQKFVPAREKFQEVEKLVPGYKTTEKYIRLTDRAIARQQEKESQTKKLTMRAVLVLKRTSKGNVKGLKKPVKRRNENSKRTLNGFLPPRLQ